ncbi:hypothetical protein [uncultured Alsobacter sp.]|uniref:hypothetical protein n=1 Tax=uncultured Alsobacter sp. TaxID=1748258 RepID=UPI0025D415EC|nr:hypothetical protein [uncultured Alsobacter sp.]
MTRVGWLALGLAVTMSSGAFAQAQDEDNGLALATVTAVSGPVRSKLKPFTSFNAPTSIEIGAGSQVTVVHHRNCVKVEISGGKLDVSFAGLETTGTVGKRERVACQGMTMAETSGVAGGVLMRSSRPGPTGTPSVAMAIEGGPRVKAGASIRLTVTPGIRAAVFVYDQDHSGELTLIQKPDGGKGAAVPAGTPVMVPDNAAARIQASSDPGEGRVIAFAVAPERSPCGYLDLFESGRPKTLAELSAAIRARAKAVAACAPTPQAPIVSDLLYTIVR